MQTYHKEELINQTEFERLRLLLNQWVNLDKQRPSFTIEKLESLTTYNVNDFQLTMRIDRIDQLNDGSEFIIDYKTSQQISKMGWYDERLTNPQIPLYILSQHKQCQAAAFALAKRGEPKYVGISSFNTDIKGVASTENEDSAWQWPSLIEQWRQQITALTQEIKQGYAAVEPALSSHACDHCDYYLLCRVYHD